MDNLNAVIEEVRRKFPRAAQARWDKEHLRTVTTKLSKEDYAIFRDKCMLYGHTPYSMTKQLIYDHVLGKF